MVRKVAEDLADEISEKFDHLGALVEAADGNNQLGLHRLTIACIKLDEAIMDLRGAIEKTKVRGEIGYADE